MEVKSTVVPAAPMEQATRVTEDAVRARREAMRQQAALEHQAAAAPADEVLPDSGREDVESVEVPLLDGRVVVFGPPQGVSLRLRVMTFPDAPPGVAGMLSVLMCVRTIDGRPVRLNNMVDVTKLANSLGDSTIDLLSELYLAYWSPLKLSDLPAIKKNLRPA